jgi:hypothetical protein
MLENSLDSPEATVCDNRSLFPGPWRYGESTTGLGRTRLPSAASTWFCANIAPKSRVAIAAIVTLLHLRVFPTGCMVRTSPKQFGFLSVPKVARARRQEIRLPVQASSMPVEIDRGNPVSGSNSSRHAANATSLVGQKNSNPSLWTTTICHNP